MSKKQFAALKVGVQICRNCYDILYIYIYIKNNINIYLPRKDSTMTTDRIMAQLCMLFSVDEMQDLRGHHCQTDPLLLQMTVAEVTVRPVDPTKSSPSPLKSPAAWGRSA